MQLANGIAGQTSMWEYSVTTRSSAVLYRFCNGRRSIDGLRVFEAYLLNDESYAPNKLTDQGKQALASMNKKRTASDAKNAKRSKR
jgi:hypothetical protein